MTKGQLAVLKILGWLAIGLVLGLSIQVWLMPAVESPLGSESVANPQAAGAERPNEYFGLTRRIGVLEVSAIERANEHAEVMTRIAAIEDDVRTMANALATSSYQQSRTLVPASPDTLVSAHALRFWSGPSGVAVSTHEGPAVPLTLVGVEAEPGQTLVYEVTGSADGVICGTDVYTDDSPMAAAAVHSGALKPNEVGTIMVSVASGRESYTGSSRYGIESQDCAEWNRSYTLRRLQ